MYQQPEMEFRIEADDPLGLTRVTSPNYDLKKVAYF